MELALALGLPLWLVIVTSIGIGVIVGSFLNVYIYRFHTGKSLNGRSHCLSCGSTLAARDLFPILSYLVLKGRCRQCGCYIPVRYLLVELLTAVLFLAASLVATDILHALFLWVVFSIGIVITVYDIRHYIIPDALTIALTGLALIYLGYQTFQTKSFLPALYSIAAALLATAFFFSLWYISRGRWIGFGDVKLVFPLGLLVGAAGVFSMVVLSFWVGAAVSLGLLALGHCTRGKLRLPFVPHNLTIKSVVPFAPFMVAGCTLVLLTKANVLTFFTF